MGKWKIGVYAICKNETKFIERWAKAVAPADYVVVLDTGSTDDSIEKLKQYGIHVHECTIDPWRFDSARNLALSYMPQDIDVCVSLDMDEVIQPGWYEEIDNHWNKDVASAKCRFVFNFKEDGSENGVFWPTRIHDRHNAIWTHAIHEILISIRPTPKPPLVLEKLQIHHHPDYTKPRDYLSLLKAAVAANPKDARDTYYLGREYMYFGEWENCIKTLETYLTLSSWHAERAAAFRHMSKAWLNLGQKDPAKVCLNAAIIEAPELREAFIDLAFIYYKEGNWRETAKLIDHALIIPKPSQSFTNEGFAWGSFPYDIGSVAHYQLGNYFTALIYANKALELSPNDKRIQNNIVHMKKCIPPYTPPTS